MINNLPEEILLMVFSYLKYLELKNITSVCKYWFVVIHLQRFRKTRTLHLKNAFLSDLTPSVIKENNGSLDLLSALILNLPQVLKVETIKLGSECHIHRTRNQKILNILSSATKLIIEKYYPVDHNLARLLVKLPNLKCIKFCDAFNTLNVNGINESVVEIHLNSMDHFKQLMKRTVTLFPNVQQIFLKDLPYYNKNLIKILTKHQLLIKGLTFDYHAMSFPEDMIDLLKQMNLSKLKLIMWFSASTSSDVFQEMVPIFKATRRLNFEFYDCRSYQIGDMSEYFDNIERMVFYWGNK